MNDIYNNNMIGIIGIYNNKEYIGEVINTDNWETNKKIKVYIPELLPHFNKRNLKVTNESYKINDKYFKATTDIGIISKQVKINGQFVKPNIGENVVVKFINGDAKKCVFYMYDYTYKTE